MNATAAMDKTLFQEKLQALVTGMGVKRLLVDNDGLKEYCRLTGHDFSAYQSRDRLPIGFLMTFIDPIVTELMVAFFVKFPGTIKGVIHSSSRIEVLKPLAISARQYQEKLELRKLEDKAGKKGNYMVVDFEVILMDEQGARVASDIHQFFLKI